MFVFNVGYQMQINILLMKKLKTELMIIERITFHLTINNI